MRAATRATGMAAGREPARRGRPDSRGGTRAWDPRGRGDRDALAAMTSAGWFSRSARGGGGHSSRCQLPASRPVKCVGQRERAEPRCRATPQRVLRSMRAASGGVRAASGRSAVNSRRCPEPTQLIRRAGEHLRRSRAGESVKGGRGSASALAATVVGDAAQVDRPRPVARVRRASRRSRHDHRSRQLDGEPERVRS
jgi:hypothetical protein